MKDMYKVLIKRNVIIDQGINVKGDGSFILSFANMNVELSKKEKEDLGNEILDGVTLLTTANVDDRVRESFGTNMVEFLDGRNDLTTIESKEADLMDFVEYETQTGTLQTLDEFVKHLHTSALTRKDLELTDSVIMTRIRPIDPTLATTGGIIANELSGDLSDDNIKVNFLKHATADLTYHFTETIAGANPGDPVTKYHLELTVMKNDGTRIDFVGKKIKYLDPGAEIEFIEGSVEANSIDYGPADLTHLISDGTEITNDEFGDIEDVGDATARTEFMAGAEVGKWYKVKLGAKSAFINVRSGDPTTNFLYTGLSINAGPNGQTFEAIQGNVTSFNASHHAAGFTGDMHSPYLQLPGAFAATQFLPKAAIEQMIHDETSNDYNNTLVIAGNQIETKNSPDDSVTEWRHGSKVASTLQLTGHDVIENSTVEFIDDYNNIVFITYTPGAGQKATLVYPEGIVNADVTVSKITDWDNSWTGAGVPTGTDAGWKIEFSNPVDATGATTTFHHPSTPIRLKLVAINNEETVVDIPTDFFEDFDNVVGKSIDVDELWLQYNVADSLGNTFTNYGPHAPAKFNVFTLPAGRTIYDIEMIRTYSNNKLQWYSEYNGRYLPDRLKYLRKSLVDRLGDDCKINIKINRTDDLGSSWAEFNGWEIRPVIEGGVLNPGKVHVTNKGVYTASNGGNFGLLGSGHDIHYIVFKFKGGI